MAMVFINICLALYFLANFANGIGVNWGSTTSYNLNPNIVARMLKDNGIDSIKLYGSDASMIKAFTKTNIRVIVGIPNVDLKNFSDSDKNARDWVEKNVKKYIEDVTITYVAVGNEPFGEYLDNTLPAMKNIQKALNDVGLGDRIKATTPLNEDVYDSGLKPPSKTHFREDIKDTIVEMVRWFDINNSTFLVNINPFHCYQDLNFTKDSIFITPNATTIVTDKGTKYNNFFDLSIDKLASSLKSAGAPNLKIMVGEIGWPSDGGINANITLAEKFYAGFLSKLGTNKGTYLRPGPMEVYLSSLLDENMRSIVKGNHERHWGIFGYNGNPKYPIDFSGHGKAVLPLGAGITNVSEIWCIYDSMKKTTDMNLVQANIEYICKTADCTPVTYGSSCSNLDFNQNISYMFNMYFQMYSHHTDACNFNGLATLSFFNPSTATCKFPGALTSAGEMRVVLGAKGIAIGIMAMVLLALF